MPDLILGVVFWFVAAVWAYAALGWEGVAMVTAICAAVVGTIVGMAELAADPEEGES